MAIPRLPTSLCNFRVAQLQATTPDAHPPLGTTGPGYHKSFWEHIRVVQQDWERDCRLFPGISKHQKANRCFILSCWTVQYQIPSTIQKPANKIPEIRSKWKRAGKLYCFSLSAPMAWRNSLKGRKKNLNCFHISRKHPQYSPSWDQLWLQQAVSTFALDCKWLQRPLLTSRLWRSTAKNREIL